MGASLKTRPPEPAVRALIIFIFAALAVFVVYPLVMVIASGVLREGAWSGLLSSRAVRVPLWNSIKLGATVAITGTIVGYAAAYAILMAGIPFKRTFRFIATLPMIAPPFMIALAAIMLLGRNGVVTREVLAPIIGAQNVPEIYGFGGLVLVQTLTYFPTSMLLLLAAFAGLDPVLEEAALSQGATPLAVFRRIVVPLSTPGILASLLLLFIESLADFGNPLLLGGDFQVLSVAAFLKITGEFDTAGGALLATLLLVPALIAFFVQKYYVERISVATVLGKPSTARRAPASPAFRAAAAIIGVLVAGCVALFFGAVIYGSFVEVWGVAGTFTLQHYHAALTGARDALVDSLLLAAIATPITALLGMAIAWLLVRRRFFGKSLLALLAMLTFAVPGTVVGIGYILAFNRPPLQITGTAAIIILLFIFRNVPVGIEAGTAAIRQIDASIEEGASSLGAGAFTTFRRIVLPLIAPAFFTALAHSFVRCMTAISAVIFVVSGRWNLLTVSILGFVENSDLSRASALCMVLVVIVSAVLVLLQLALRQGVIRPVASGS